MESFGIMEMLGWYVVGFSATILTLQIISKLKDLEEKRKENSISRNFTQYPQIRIKCG
jgi:hypothetical protein